MLAEKPLLAFTDSRRLLGANPYFAGTGAALEALHETVDAAMLDAWRERVVQARKVLDWLEQETFAHAHPGGATLALAARLDCVLTATEVNEWAWEATLLSFSLREKVPEGRMRADSALSKVPVRKKLPFDEETRTFIRTLRHESTNAEHLIWSFVRERRLDGKKFRRQHPLGPYVLDFYCHEAGLAVELDGGQHNEADRAARDERRDAFVAAQGIHTLRFWNDDVLARTEDVLAEIWRAVHFENRNDEGTGQHSPSSALRAPSPGGRRECNHASANWLHAPGHPAAWDEDAAMVTLRLLAAEEASPALLALEAAAGNHRVAFLLDDEQLSLGEGNGSRMFRLDPMPEPERIHWSSLHDVPVSLVTGTNGKTTTVRLLAAMARGHGLSTGHSCTDGLFVEGRQIASGDYSGPAGAREVLRQTDVQCAILETARGGILRRGLAMQHAQAAVITNIGADHFGAYGVHGLDDLARVKFTVARVLDRGGLLVLNGDDPTLRAHAADVECAIGWFALDDDARLLQEHRAAGGATCGLRDGQVVLTVGGTVQDLGAIADMPLTVAGVARYNIANILAASLAATALGVPAATIGDVLARFGSTHADNPGRLQRWSLAGVEAWLDYAHNPDGLRGLLDVTDAATREGRFGLLLGQAGDRNDEDIRELARVAARYRPDHVVLKDLPAFMRGRAPGEVAAVLRGALVASGIAAEATEYADDEERGARALLAWAQPGDLVILPVHGKAARAQVSTLLDRMAAMHWAPGQALP